MAEKRWIRDAKNFVELRSRPISRQTLVYIFVIRQLRCRWTIRHCTLWIRDMTLGLGDHFGPDNPVCCNIELQLLNIKVKAIYTVYISWNPNAVRHYEVPDSDVPGRCSRWFSLTGLLWILIESPLLSRWSWAAYKLFINIAYGFEPPGFSCIIVHSSVTLQSWSRNLAPADPLMQLWFGLKASSEDPKSLVSGSRQEMLHVSMTSDWAADGWSTTITLLWAGG